ncbi:Sensory transduction protein lytR [Slackia heliotrinireducens]|uniref:Response regulator of the LytR/AlgR family n=1 Tax=Slackia heliotrinireducens (strain ATCC 29202 / DSM 20476 / NCTC 11029 / RHS 1) TaxID=471855 RepID=C7N704_SLAHD|nr:LytTR family DNA-binding domain-containing protein [Slackia heliotrinireducens]ACV22689.1 response regulator of the LytR/AlgR family [Slackia heliotrinireducens DSM 20476]VEH01284.1 Sensory transduction protein lytR [Slackia heliotrinireducens]
MDVEIERIGEGEKELVLIRCRAVTDEVREIADFVKSRQGRLMGVLEGMQYEVPLPDVHYIESVDGRTFLYTKDQVFETPYRIYELENRLAGKQFLRISKSMLLNLMKVGSIRPAFNGRFVAVLRSGEEVIVSRSYVKGLKAALRGE